MQMRFENNVWEVAFITALVILVSWPAVHEAKKGAAKEYRSVAVRNYLAPIGSASFLFLTGGFEWWAVAAGAICLILSAVLIAYRGEMHRWVLHLPLYTRLVTCLVTVSPIVASVLYCLYAPNLHRKN